MATAQLECFVAVEIGDLEKETRSKKVEERKFTTDFPGAVIREGADELTLRAREEGVLHAFYRRHECWELKEGGRRSSARGERSRDGERRGKRRKDGERRKSKGKEDTRKNRPRNSEKERRKQEVRREEKNTGDGEKNRV